MVIYILFPIMFPSVLVRQLKSCELLTARMGLGMVVLVACHLELHTCLPSHCCYLRLTSCYFAVSTLRLIRYNMYNSPNLILQVLLSCLRYYRLGYIPKLQFLKLVTNVLECSKQHLGPSFHVNLRPRTDLSSLITLSNTVFSKLKFTRE